MAAKGMVFGTDSGLTGFIRRNRPSGEHGDPPRRSGSIRPPFRPQSGGMPASFTPLAHSATSALMIPANSARDAGFGGHPARSSLFCTSGDASAVSSALLMRSTIGAGVPAGTAMPNHGVTWAPG